MGNDALARPAGSCLCCSEKKRFASETNERDNGDGIQAANVNAAAADDSLRPNLCRFASSRWRPIIAALARSLAKGPTGEHIDVAHLIKRLRVSGCDNQLVRFDAR